jgi:hypothetical protein
MITDINELNKRRDALDMVNNIKGQIEKQRIHYEQDWANWYKLYRGISYRTNYNGRVNLFVPETYNDVETNVAYLSEALLPGKEFFGLVGRDISEQDKVQGVLNTDLIKYKLERADFEQKLQKMLRSLAIYGTVVTPFSWEKKYRTQFQKQPNKEDILNNFGDVIQQVTKLTTAEVEVLVYDGFDVGDPLDLNDFYIDVTKNIDSAPGIIRKQRTTYNDIKKLSEQIDVDGLPIYDNIEGLENEGWNPQKQPNISNKGVSVGDVIYEKHKEIELDHFWGLYDLNGKYVECHITVAAGNKVIRMRRNKFDCQRRPYHSSQYIPIESEFYGMGIPELIETLQIELNDKRSQTFDDATFRLCRMWKKRKGSGILNNQLKARANGVIDVDDMNDIEPLDIPAYENTGYQAEAMIKEDIRQTTNAIATMQGMPSKYKTSATEVVSMKGGSDLKNKQRVKWLETTLIRPIIERSYEYIHQFIEDKDVLQILGEEGMEWIRERNEAVYRFYNVIPMGSQIMESRYVAQQQLLNFINIASKIPPNVVKINLREAMRRLWEGFGFRNTNAIIPDTEPPQMIMELLKEYSDHGIPPREAALQIMTLVQQLSMDMMTQQQNPQGGGQQPNVGVPPQEQPQPESEMEAGRSAGTINGEEA